MHSFAYINRFIHILWGEGIYLIINGVTNFNYAYLLTRWKPEIEIMNTLVSQFIL